MNVCNKIYSYFPELNEENSHGYGVGVVGISAYLMTNVPVAILSAVICHWLGPKLIPMSPDRSVSVVNSASEKFREFQAPSILSNANLAVPKIHEIPKDKFLTEGLSKVPPIVDNVHVPKESEKLQSDTSVERDLATKICELSQGNNQLEKELAGAIASIPDSAEVKLQLLSDELFKKVIEITKSSGSLDKILPIFFRTTDRNQQEEIYIFLHEIYEGGLKLGDLNILNVLEKLPVYTSAGRRLGKRILFDFFQDPQEKLWALPLTNAIVEIKELFPLKAKLLEDLSNALQRVYSSSDRKPLPGDAVDLLCGNKIPLLPSFDSTKRTALKGQLKDVTNPYERVSVFKKFVELQVRSKG